MHVTVGELTKHIQANMKTFIDTEKRYHAPRREIRKGLSFYFTELAELNQYPVDTPFAVVVEHRTQEAKQKYSSPIPIFSRVG